VVGSQAVLGSFREDELPADATMSVEVDIMPIANSNDETARLADLIEGVAGEFSRFEQLHGFSIDGVDLETSTLPDGWRDRVGESAERQHCSAGWTAAVHRLVSEQGRSCVAKLCAFREKDRNLCVAKLCAFREKDRNLCVAKLCAFREKDRNFVVALLEARLVDAGVIHERLPSVERRGKTPARCRPCCDVVGVMDWSGLISRHVASRLAARPV
jgi:hypothetical protein